MEESVLIDIELENEGNLEEIEVSENEIIEEIQEDAQETVSMGDVIPFSAINENGTLLTVEDITLAIENAGVTLVPEQYTLWDKPLEEYTVTEGLLLILVLCAVGLVIHKIIGGVLNCKQLLKK